MRKLTVLGASLLMLSLVLASAALAAEKAGTATAKTSIADTNSLAAEQQAGVAGVETKAKCTYSGSHFDGYFCGPPPAVIEVTFSKTGSSACSFDATIDWGDGTTTTLTDVQNGDKTSHEYTKPAVNFIQGTGTVHSSDPGVTCTFHPFTLVVEVAGPPRVLSVDPLENAKEVSRDTDVTATFSEEIDPDTITGSTVKLINTKSGRKVSAALNYDNSSRTTVTLDPSRLLAVNRKYKGVITTDVKDLAGNALDQNPDASGNQPKIWYFTTGTN